MKVFFIILNFFLIATLAYCLFETGYKKLVPQNLTLPEQEADNTKIENINPGQNNKGLDTNFNNIIVKRNLFKVEIEQKQVPGINLEKEDKEPEPIEHTKLQLVLWGTVTGQENVYAVIEDNKIKEQALYQVDDFVQGAKLKKISRNKVILTFQGKDQLLEIQTNPRNVSKSRKLKEEINIRPAPANEVVNHDVQDSLDTMMGQIKFRPHFSEGEPDGLMVYGIRPKSVFRKIGLRNGDIIKDINGATVNSNEDISPLLTEIKDQENLKISIFRRGKAKELIYNPFLEEDNKEKNNDVF